MGSNLPVDEQFSDVQVGNWISVFRFALALTNEWDAAEDLAQEAFARLWANRAKVDWSRPVLPWLLTVTRRLALDRFRRIRRALTQGRRSDGRSLDGEDRIRWLDVRRSIGALPPLDRAALLMVTIDGLSYEEAADALGTTPGAVRARVSRARRKLDEATA